MNSCHDLAGTSIDLLLLGLYCVIPLVHLLALSYSDRAAATSGLVMVWPVRSNTITYEKVFEASVFLSAFWVSVIRTVVGTTLQMALVVLISFPLSKDKEGMPFRNVIMGSVVFAYLLNGGLIPWFLVIRKLGMLNTIWALTIPQVLPLWNVIPMMNFLRRVRDMLQARIVDPTPVVKAALHQAVSGATMLTSAGALVLPRTPGKGFGP